MPLSYTHYFQASLFEANTKFGYVVQAGNGKRKKSVLCKLITSQHRELLDLVGPSAKRHGPPPLVNINSWLTNGNEGADSEKY